MKFNPKDPTVWLWKRLLKGTPSQHWRRPLSPQEKDERAKQGRTHWAEHKHPRTGKPFKNK